MEEMNLNNILGEDEVNLFMDDEDSGVGETTPEAPSKEDAPSEEAENDKKENPTTEVNPEALFSEDSEEQPESVGSEKTPKEGKEEGSTADTGDGSSPIENFYSSIANAMAEDGILPNLTEEALSGVVDAESFSAAIEQEINARFDEKQLRISKALDNGVAPNDIRIYEGTIQRLSTIKDTDLTAENEQGEQLRYQLITQDYMNKGFSREKADKMAKRSIDAGNDIDDAKEALQSNKEYFQDKYDKVLKDAEAEAEATKATRRKQAEKLKDSIMKDKTLLGDIEVSHDVRKKVVDNISKPVYRDPETGDYLTALQKYELEHKEDFIKNVGLLYTLTNGFKDFDTFTKGKVKKEMKKGIKELVDTLNTTRRSSNGGLKMVTSQREDPETFFSKGFKLDLGMP